MCVNRFCVVAMNRIPGRNSGREKMFILCNTFGRFQSVWQGRHGRDPDSRNACQSAAGIRTWALAFRGPPPSPLLPLARHHFLNPHQYITTYSLPALLLLSPTPWALCAPSVPQDGALTLSSFLLKIPDINLIPSCQLPCPKYWPYRGRCIPITPAFENLRVAVIPFLIVSGDVTTLPWLLKVIGKVEFFPNYPYRGSSY